MSPCAPTSFATAAIFSARVAQEAHIQCRRLLRTQRWLQSRLNLARSRSLRHHRQRANLLKPRPSHATLRGSGIFDFPNLNSRTIQQSPTVYRPGPCVCPHLSADVILNLCALARCSSQLSPSSSPSRSPPAAQEDGPWRAASTNSRAITGDVVFSPLKISINFTAFTIAQIRSLKTEEVLALFNPDSPTGGGKSIPR